MGKQIAVFTTESNRKKSDALVQVGEKDIPKPGTGEVLVRITLRPVRLASFDPMLRRGYHRDLIEIFNVILPGAAS